MATTCSTRSRSGRVAVCSTMVRVHPVRQKNVSMRSAVAAHAIAMATAAVIMASSAVAAGPPPLPPPPSTQWKVVDNVDAVADAGPHSALLGSASSVDACEALCDAAHGCDIWTWNHEVPPHHCFGGVDPEAKWVSTHNTHCTSGCRGDACTSSPPSPAPPAPPPQPPSEYFPRWVGKRPEVATNRSAGLPVLPSTEHILVYNATGPDGRRNPFGVYNHGPIVTKYSGLYYMSWYNGACCVGRHTPQRVARSCAKRSQFTRSLCFFLRMRVHGCESSSSFCLSPSLSLRTLFVCVRTHNVMRMLTPLLFNPAQRFTAPVNETWYKRSVFATSEDGVKWSAPSELFPPFTQQPCPKCGEENGPWTILGATDSSPGRL
jgi:hypothetical protein